MVTLKSLIERARDAGGSGELRPVDYLVAVGLTVGVAILTWRVMVATGSALALSAMLAAPIIIASRSAIAGLASLLAVAAVTLVLLPFNPAKMHIVAFLFAGVSLVVAVVYGMLSSGWTIGEARRAIAELRYRQTLQSHAIDAAGLLELTLSANLVWRGANPAAWTAFGCEPLLQRSDGRLDLDDEAVSALMHSGSRENWRSLLEAVKAEQTAIGSKGRLRLLKPRHAKLFDRDGTAKTFLFFPSFTERGELHFLAQAVQGDVDEPAAAIVRLEAWFYSLVSDLAYPAAAIAQDGTIVSYNRSFERRLGRLEPGTRIFDLDLLRGVDDGRFATDIWSAAIDSTIWIDELVLADDLRGAYAERVSPGFSQDVSVLLLRWDLPYRSGK